MPNDKRLGLLTNKEQATMLLKGLELLPPQDKGNVVYETLVRELKTIVTIWDRRIKNEKILQRNKATNLVYPKQVQKAPSQKGLRPEQ